MEITFDPNQIFQIQLSNASLDFELLITSLISAAMAFFAVVKSSKIAAKATSENTKAIFKEMNMRLGNERILQA